MHPNQRKDCQTTYDTVADEYAWRISDELRHKPLDRQLLDRFAASVRNTGLVCDVGCGPGHVAEYLHGRGVKIHGIDLSAAMVEQARRLHPDIDFRQGDMLALDSPDGAWAGVVAFYSIIHIPPDELAQVLRELWRVLLPGGVLLLGFHLGDDTVHLDEWWGQTVRVDFFFYPADRVLDALRTAGFEIGETIERPPYPDIEHQSQRAYISALRPEAKGCSVPTSASPNLLQSDRRGPVLDRG